MNSKELALPQLAGLTENIYWPQGGRPSSPLDIDGVSAVAPFLKKNRILHDVVWRMRGTVDESHPLFPILQEERVYQNKLSRSLEDLYSTLGKDRFLVIKTYYGYRRLTTDLDIVVKNIPEARRLLESNGWRAGPEAQGTQDLEKEGALPIGLHVKVGWDTPPIFSSNLLWAGLREEKLADRAVWVPSTEVDMMSLLAHIPFEKLYVDWGEMCYLYSLAGRAELSEVMRQAQKFRWASPLRGLLFILNSVHRQAFDAPGPFEGIYPRWSSRPIPLPFEMSFLSAGFSLLGIGAWRKMAGVVFNPLRAAYFFKGRSERRQIKV